MSDDNTITGIVLRQEEVFTAEQSGYVNYYVNDGGRTARKDVVYTIDETGNIYPQLTEAADNETLPKETENNIERLLMRYQKENSGQFQSVYGLKDSLMTEVLQASGTSMLSSLETILKTYGDGSNFHVGRADESGIVAYYTDGYESRTKADIRYADFETADSYTKVQTPNASLIEKDRPVYKLIPSETWSIILPLTEEQFVKLSDRDYVDILIRRDGIKTTAAVSVYQNSGEYFAELTLGRYMVRYAGQRFLDVTLSLNSVSGLKIPKSSVVDRTFYKVPLAYFTAGGNSREDGLVKETFTENGEIEDTYYPAEIYYQEDDYAYISTDGYFKAGDRIRMMDSTESYVISETGNLKGVYNANKGYTVFRRIETLYENEEYCIVADNTQFGLSEYDHIILQGELAVDRAIIY